MDQKSKKILYIITKSVWAGAGKYVHDLATNLPKDSYEVVVAAGGKDVLFEKLKKDKISYIEVKNFQRDVNPLRDIAAFFEIFSLIKKEKPDIIHVSSAKAGGVVGLASWLYSFLYRKNTRRFFTVHGWTFSERRPAWQIVLIKLFSHITCLFYDKIICVSEHDRKIAIGNNISSSKKLVTIHNGIKINDYNFLEKGVARKELELPENSFIIGTIGEFTKNKGHRYLIEAAESLKHLTFAIIGFGEDEKYLKDKVKEFRLEDRFFIITDKPNASIYLKAFDVFTLPSIKEGLPYVLQEAGLAELPIIASNVSGIPEIIVNQESGLLTEPMAPYELQGTIESVYKNPELAKNLAQKARQKVIMDFSFEKMMSETMAIYEA